MTTPVSIGRPPDQGNCYRCGKPLGTFCPVLLGLTRNGVREDKKLCDDCFQTIFDSIEPLQED